LAFSSKKRQTQTKKIFVSLEFDFFRVQLKFAFRIRLLVLLSEYGRFIYSNIIETTKQGKLH